MKYLFIILSFTCMMNAQAGLITTVNDQTLYNLGDIVLVDFYVNDANPVIDWLNIDFLVNSTHLKLIDFTVTDDVYFNSYYDDAYTMNDLFIVELGLLQDWSSNLGSSFKWGQAQFMALSKIEGLVFEIDNIVAQDIDYNDVSPQKVPEPSTYLLFIVTFFILFRARNKSFK